MYIKLTAIADDKLGDHDAKRIDGEKVENGEKWSKKIFANDKALRPQLEKFSVGEFVEVKLERNGKFWNVSEIKEVDMAEIERVKAEAQSKKSNNYGGSSGSYTKSPWNGRTGEAYDRSAAIYLALDFFKTKMTTAELKKLTVGDLIQEAENLNDYIHNGINNYIDPLDPDDDLPH